MAGPYNTVLNGKEIYTGSAQIFTPEYRQMIEDHLSYIRNHVSTRVLQIANIMKIRYDYDLYGFIAAQYRADYAWVVMRVNGFYTSLEFNMAMGTSDSLILPDIDLLENLKKKHQSQTLII